MTAPPEEDRRKRASAWFQELRDYLCAALEELEDALIGPNTTSDHPPGRFERTAWRRGDAGADAGGDAGGGGVMSVIRGRV